MSATLYACVTCGGHRTSLVDGECEHCAKHVAPLRERLREVEAERDGAVARAGDKERAEHRALARLLAEKAALRAERDSMRPVVEAAVRWETERPTEEATLANAVVAYLADHDTRASKGGE